MADQASPKSGKVSPKQADDEQQDKEVEELDFEITLGTRRDAASEAGSDDEGSDEAGSEGFITGARDWVFRSAYHMLVRLCYHLQNTFLHARAVLLSWPTGCCCFDGCR